MKSLRFVVVLSFLLMIAGCAVGNRYDYRESNISLPLNGSGDLSSGVIDMRSYVMSGEKSPEFIGLQRGGFGNPFEVKTSSGKPLADDFNNALSQALLKAGYNVRQLYFSSPDSSVVTSVISENGSEKNVVLYVTEWKTDVMMNMRLIFDLVLKVYDKKGELLAKNQLEGDEKISGAGFESQNSKTAAAAFETKIGRLFNNPEILDALK